MRRIKVAYIFDGLKSDGQRVSGSGTIWFSIEGKINEEAHCMMERNIKEQGSTPQSGVLQNVSITNVMIMED